MDTSMNTPTDGTGPGKKKPLATPASKYKAMVKKPAAADNDADSPGGKLMVEKADGSIGEWGNPIKPPATPPAAAKKKTGMSDKASGLSGTYYSGNSQQQAPATPAIKKSNNYY